MEKFKALLKSKKFWTLIAAIVAALTAFFTTSCSASARVQRSGIHIDTVRVDYIIRSRNVQTASVCPTDQFNPIRPLSILKSSPFTPVFGTSIAFVCPMRLSAESFVGLSPLRNGRSLDCSQFLSLSSSMKSIISITSMPNCSEDGLFLSNLPSPTSGEKCLIAFVPIAFVKRSRRRGGRRGKPRPSTKTVTLGGSHL